LFTTVYHYVFFHQWPLDSDHIEHVAEFAEHQIQRYVLLPFNKRWATYQACGSAFISSERIHHFRLNTDYRPGSRAFITKNLKNVAGRKFWSKTTIYLSLGLQLQKKPSIPKKGHPTLQNMTYTVYIFFDFCAKLQKVSKVSSCRTHLNSNTIFLFIFEDI
jgi:hypothetical protein